MADLLDQWGVFRSRLFRESCVFYRGNYVKDLERLGRDLHRVAIVDNSPASYIFHPEHAVRIDNVITVSLSSPVAVQLVRVCCCARDPCWLITGRGSGGWAASFSPPPIRRGMEVGVFLY